MLLTERDRHVIEWINRLGFVTVEQVAAYYQIARSTAYHLLHRLHHHEYLKHERILHNGYGAYSVTKKGIENSDSDLPPVKSVSNSTLFRHQIMVANLSIILPRLYQGEFITERQLRQSMGLHGVGQKHHVSDGALKFADKSVAIEVELSTKGKGRLEKIIKHYVKDFSFKEVWYFYCDNEVGKKLTEVAKDHQFIKIYELNLILNKLTGA